MHQLDLTRPGADESSLQALAIVGGAMDQLAAESAPVKLDRPVEVGHRHSDVMDPRQAFHVTENTRVTAFTVITLGISPSILSLPLSSLSAPPRPTSSKAVGSPRG